MPTSNPDSAGLSEPQRIALVARWQEIDRLMSEVEGILASSSSNSVFPKYKSEVNPVQARIIRDYVAAIRREILQSAKALGVELPAPALQSIHSVRVGLIFAEVAAEECTPERLRGYGELDPAAVPQLRGMVEQMKASIRKLMDYLSETADLSTRLERLNRADNDSALLYRIIDVVDRRGLVEFRPAIASILERMETRTFEIAVFGRVSSGKSSLLNHVLGTNVLPVGVTPVTAVPTRIMFGLKPRLRVTTTTTREEKLPIERLPEFVTEDHNRGNEKRVIRLTVEIPSERLREGIVFVDTPGLGSLATSGAAETRAYLPRSDFGVVLIDSASTITEEDVATIRMLLEAGTPASVLLSKADLISPSDREQAIAYTRSRIHETLGADVSVRAVSVISANAGLLEAWFAEDIAPLYQRHEEIAAESIRRKIGVLRESLEAALKLRADKQAGVGSPGPQAVARAASRLRDAAGAFDRSSRACFEFLDRLLNARRVVISGIAHEAFSLMQQPGTDTVESEWIRATAIRMTAGVVKDIPRILADLALGSATALCESARDLNIAHAPAAGEFSAAIREMPVLDIGAVQSRLRTGFAAKFSRSLAIRGLEHSLDEQIGAALQQALSVFSGVLQQWLRSTLGEMRQRFDVYAESYRATIARLQGIEAPGAQTDRRGTGDEVFRDLDQIRAEAPAAVQESGA